MQWCNRIADMLSGNISISALPTMLHKDLQPYYTPLQEDGSPAHFLKTVPKTNPEICSHCGKCASACPMNSISPENESEINGICIKCQACIKTCPVNAKYFDDEQFLSHVRMLENTYTRRAQNTFL